MSTETGSENTISENYEPIDAGLHGSQTHLLSRGLSTFSIVLMVVAAAAPMTVAATTVPTMLLITGSTSVPFFFLAAAVVLLLFAVGFTKMSKYVKNAGAFYSYIQAGLGRRVGIGSAALALVSYYVFIVALYAILGVLSSSALATYIGTSLPWWWFSALAWGAITLLGYRDIELSAKVLGVGLVLETLGVVVVSLAVVFRGGAEGLTATPFIPQGLSASSLGFGLMFAVAGFIGFEATAVFRHEARDPDTTIPRATYIAVAVIGVFYAFSSWATVMGVGIDHMTAALASDPTNMLFNLATQYVSPVLHNVLQALVVTSLFACLLAFHNVMTRYLFTLGGFGILPKRLGVINVKHRTPSFASITMSVVTALGLLPYVVAGLDPYTVAYQWLAGMGMLGLLTLMGLTSCAVIAFFWRQWSELGLWGSLIAPALALVGMAVVVYMVVANFALLVGNEPAAAALEVVLVAAFVAGVVRAVVLRRTEPDAYARLASGHEGAAPTRLAVATPVPDPVG